MAKVVAVCNLVIAILPPYFHSQRSSRPINSWGKSFMEITFLLSFDTVTRAAPFQSVILGENTTFMVRPPTITAEDPSADSKVRSTSSNSRGMNLVWRSNQDVQYSSMRG